MEHIRLDEGYGKQYRAGHRNQSGVCDYYGDFSKIKEVLGWTPRTSLRDGLQKTLDFYKENLNWYLE